MFYLTTHSTYFMFGYMASGIWKRTTQIAREETRCHHIDYSFRLAARVLLYASSHRQDNTYHGLCYTSHGALAGTKSINGFAMKDRSNNPSHHDRITHTTTFVTPVVGHWLEEREIAQWVHPMKDRSNDLSLLSAFLKANISVFSIRRTQQAFVSQLYTAPACGSVCSNVYLCTVGS